MLKRLLIISFVFVIATNVVVAQEEDFHFSNWPLANFEKRKIINPFGESHFGVDVAAEVGEEVKAVADGKVYWTYSGGPHGISVGVEHQNGWRTTYLHLSERLVKKGQEVKALDVIGKVGTTGSGRDAEEPHLHFALIVDPSADVSNFSKRYADSLAYGPIQDIQPTEEVVPEQQPVPIVSNPEIMPEEITPTELSPIPQQIASPRQLLEKSTEHIKAKLQAAKKLTSTRIKKAQTNLVRNLQNLVAKTLKQYSPQGKKVVHKTPASTEFNVFSRDNKGVIVFYWFVLAAIGCLYYWINRKKANIGFTPLPILKIGRGELAKCFVKFYN